MTVKEASVALERYPKFRISYIIVFFGEGPKSVRCRGYHTVAHVGW